VQRLSVLTAALTASVVLATTARTAPAHASTLVVLEKGHVDVVDVEFEAGEFELLVHDETVEPAVEREPDEVLFRALPGSQTTVPADPAFSFLGAPGAPVWVLPQQDNPDLLFAGLSTEELEPGVFTADSVTVKLRGVFGPGRFSFFVEDAVGQPQVLFNSGDGLPDAFPLAIGTHQHANWAFTKKGTYVLILQVSATLAATGETVRSDSVPYLFKVG
jgi:surface-anchored protein